MIAVAKSDDIIEKTGKRTGYELIGEKDGCVNGCRCGVSVYTPGVCFVVPAGVKHCMKCEQDSGFCKVFWFHAAV